MNDVEFSNDIKVKDGFKLIKFDFLNWLKDKREKERFNDFYNKYCVR